jgi:DNA-binding SARP family transcriptional activator
MGEGNGSFERVSFTVLGPLRAGRGNSFLDLGTPQQKLVLTVLLLAEGVPVTADELIERAWGSEAPGSVVSSIRTYVHRLRAIVGPANIRTVGDGYQLVLAPGDLDLAQFRELTALSEVARRRGDHEIVRAALREALALWKGPALAGMRGAYANAQRMRMNSLRTAALEACLKAELELGASSEVVAELTELVAADQLNERLRAMLMLALYRSGRQAAALSTYADARSMLAEELGVDPSPTLQVMYQRILRADEGLLALAKEAQPTDAAAVVPVPKPPPAPRANLTIPAQLPAAPAAFAGRNDLMAEAQSLITNESCAPATVFVVTGMAGVGKTAFAVQLAHSVADQFPDGQIHVNLRGFDPSGAPLSADQALRNVLDTFGVAPQSLPQGIDALAARFRTLLAGRQVLILLDNARDSAQVRPLLPGSSGCLTIVTSRSHMTGLIASDGATPLQLDLLSVQESRELLAHRLGERRVADEPEAVDVIVEQCGRLPLALSIVAARAAIRSTFRLVGLAEELRDGWGGLNAFTAAEPGGMADVRAVFSWSYQALTHAAARMFRLLSLHPGPDISISSAAGLAGLPVLEARRLLVELAQACLVDELTPGRYSSHNLLRTYASELTVAIDSASERESAERRLLDYYLHSACAADERLNPDRYRIELPAPTSLVRPESFADCGLAAKWLTDEQAVLLAAIEQAEARQWDEHAWQLTWVIGLFLDQRNLWRERDHWMDRDASHGATPRPGCSGAHPHRARSGHDEPRQGR